MNNNPWIELKELKLVPHATRLEFWDDYGEQVISGELRHYDGKHIIVSMRHWWMELSPFDFSHYRLPEPESEYPQRVLIEEPKND